MGKLVGGLVLGGALLLATVHDDYVSPSLDRGARPLQSHGIRLPEHQVRARGPESFRNDAGYRDSGEPYSEIKGPVLLQASASWDALDRTADWPEP